MDEIIQDTEQQPTTQPADNGDQGSERMFTQAEVDKIVRDRLARERAKAAPQEPTEAELKEKALAAKESRFTCKEYLSDRGYPMELLDVLDTSDHKEFAKKADIVSGLLRAAKGPAPLYNPEPRKSTEDGFFHGYEDGFARVKHTPRQYPFAYDD